VQSRRRRFIIAADGSARHLMREFFARTLAGKALLRLAVLGAAVLLLFGLLGAAVLYRQIEAQETERLALQAAERARVAEQVLGHVVEMHRTVRDEFVRRWPAYQDSATAQRFDTLLERDAAGAWRSRREIADGRFHPTGWVRQGTALDDGLRRRVVLFHDLSSRYGPGAATRNDNLYFVAVPEQANMGYDPFLSPTWSTDVLSDYDQLGEEWGRVAYAPAAPGAPTRWSAPELDEVNPGMGSVFAALTPIHVGERHVAAVGTTIVVKEFLARVLPPPGADTQYLVLLADGRTMGAAAQAQRALAAPAAGGGPAYSGSSRDDDMLFALARIDGPGWYVAATLPGAVLRARAATPLLWALAVGAAALLLPLLIVAAMLRRQVAQPLAELTRAAEALAGGDTGVRLPVSRDDELGRLAGAFNDMTGKVALRDAALREDKRQIEQALDALRLTEERWRAMTDNASDVIAVTDGGGVIRYVSPPVRRMLGVAAEALVGSNAFERVHPDDVAGLRARLGGRDGARASFRARHADGSWRVLEAVGSALHEHPAIRGRVLNIRDVSDTARAEQELARQREALHQSEKLSALGSLLAGVAHELNNPLTVVVGRAMQMEEDAATPLDRGRAQKIRLAAERCTRIVRTFLAMARRQPAERRATDLNEVLRGALELLGYVLTSGDVQVRLQLDASLPAVLADADQLSQVFLNLYTNAQQAMARTPAPRLLSVTSRATPDARQVVVEVADSGPGVPAELAGRIFEPYFTTKPAGEGTGVGLAVSLGIVQAHGGTLLLEQAPGRGACFVLSLPALHAQPAGAAQHEAGPDDGLAGEPLRVLVVDDEPEIAEFLRDILEAAGHGVALAEDGHAALRHLELQEFDVVLMDLKMPGMDGPALHAQIACRHAALLGRIAAMTGDLLSGGVQAFLRDSALPVLDKPFQPEQVLALVRRLGRPG
jgi:PAS domain S-box-containing protein